MTTYEIAGKNGQVVQTVTGKEAREQLLTPKEFATLQETGQVTTSAGFTVKLPAT